MFRTHMVCMGAALLALLTCVAITGCVDSDPPYNDAGQSYCANITIAETDYGSLMGPYYVISTEPFKYATRKGVYYFAKGNVGNQVSIVYITSDETGHETRSIVSMSSLCCNSVSSPVCCKPVPTPTPCCSCECGVK